MMQSFNEKIRKFFDCEKPLKRTAAVFLKKTSLCKIFKIHIGEFKIWFSPSAQAAFAWYDARRFMRESDILSRLVVPGAVCMDVGANIGLAAIPMALKAGEKGCVVAIEPDKRIAGFLSSNIRLNALTNVCVVNSAVGDREGKVSFAQCKADDMSHVIEGDNQGAVSVAMETLDSITENYAAIHLVKIDVEGFERNVLWGASETLKKTLLILIEISRENFRRYGYEPSKLISILNSYGFKLYRVSEDKLIEILPEDDVGENAEDIVGVRSVEMLLNLGFKI